MNFSSTSIKLLAAATVVTLATGCTKHTMGYRRPERWEYVRLPPIEAVPNQSPLMKAARYQIQVCENIAAGYAELSTNSSKEGTFYKVIGPVLTAVGAASTATSTLLTKDSDEQKAFAITGISATLIGGALAINTAFTGDARSESYSKASASVYGAADKFREALRGKIDASDEALKERICSLRAACFQNQINLRPVGDPFGPTSGQPGRFDENKIVEQYVTSFCSHASSEPGFNLSSCGRPSNASNPQCPETACEAALKDRNNTAAIANCMDWYDRRHDQGDPTATDPVQVLPNTSKIE
ncbi:hypothetical protein [Corallococcus sp. 4LFB]|uniref:hypothetical protein n=1 Tax=Corallococcus sp. 4LFB TaxID=3383249 RepID=UPI003976E52E